MARDLAGITTRLQVTTRDFGKGMEKSAVQLRTFTRRIQGAAPGVEVSINTAGLKELEARLTAVPQRVQGNILRQTVREASAPLLAEARATAPIGDVVHKTYKGRTVLPGFTRRNIKVETFVTKDKSSALALVGVVREAYYALQFLELGTARIRKRPWLAPAFNKTLAQQIALVQSALKRRLEAIGA